MSEWTTKAPGRRERDYGDGWCGIWQEHGWAAGGTHIHGGAAGMQWFSLRFEGGGVVRLPGSEARCDDVHAFLVGQKVGGADGAGPGVSVEVDYQEAHQQLDAAGVAHCGFMAVSGLGRLTLRIRYLLRRLNSAQGQAADYQRASQACTDYGVPGNMPLAERVQWLGKGLKAAESREQLWHDEAEKLRAATAPVRHDYATRVDDVASFINLPKLRPGQNLIDAVTQCLNEAMDAARESLRHAVVQPPAAPVAGKTCEGCAFKATADHGEAECRRYPEVLLGHDRSESVWDSPPAVNRCGEYRPALEVRDAASKA